MWAIRKNFSEGSSAVFQLSYLANVAGAVTGADRTPADQSKSLASCGTLKIGAILNGLLFGIRNGFVGPAAEDDLEARSIAPSFRESDGKVRKGTSAQEASGCSCCYSPTGLTSMGAEVVWIRLFTPYLATPMVYAFAMILGVYLASTFVGSRIYRRWSRTGSE